MNDIPKKFLILIADDTPANIQILGHLLKNNKYNTAVSTNGIEVLEFVKKQIPDLILMDVMMPKMDGIIACKHLKENSVTRSIPVIFITALTSTGDKLEAFEAGGVDYISKPFVKEEVLARVQVVLDREFAYKKIESQKFLLEKNALEMKELNDRLLISEEKLKEENSNKDRFFTIIAHDLKSPFSGLLGMMELINGFFDDFTLAELKEKLEEMGHSIKSISNLLINLLEWSRIQTGRIEYYPENHDFSDISEFVVNLLKSNASNKGIILVNEINRGTFVFSDTNLGNTVLRNLVANAIKFTNPGGVIKIFADRLDDCYLISVEDDGIGINSEDLGKLFRIDVHHSSEGTQKEQGTGLGLILCKSLIEKNGGKLWAESTIGKGSTFKFTLPAIN